MKDQTIAVLGGTGDLGAGLAMRWAAAGHRLIIGSRKLAKAEEAVAEFSQTLAERGIEAHALQAMDNDAAAAACDIAALTVPFAHQASTLEALRERLRGKIVIDVTVPLMPPAVGTVQLPPEGCAALVARRALGDDARIVSAFQNVAAHHLRGVGDIDCDVLVCADDEEAATQVVALAQQAGMRAFHAGPLANAAASEALTSLLITLNKRHRCRAGVRITGVPE